MHRVGRILLFFAMVLAVGASAMAEQPIASVTKSWNEKFYTHVDYTITATDVIVGGGGSQGSFSVTNEISGCSLQFVYEVRKNGVLLYSGTFTSSSLDLSLNASAGDVIRLSLKGDIIPSVPAHEVPGDCTGKLKLGV